MKEIIVEQLNPLREFFNSKSDANKYLEASEQEDLEREFEEWYSGKLNDLEFAARPLVKHLAENYHPHTHATVDSNSVKIFEGKKTLLINDYIPD